jgi:hypothetical protein
MHRSRKEVRVGLKVKPGMWCDTCQKPVAGQKTTRKAAAFGKLLATGGAYTDLPQGYHCPTCGSPVRRLSRPRRATPTATRSSGSACAVAGCACTGYVFERRQDNPDGTVWQLCRCGHTGGDHTGARLPATPAAGAARAAAPPKKSAGPKAYVIAIAIAAAIVGIIALLSAVLGWSKGPSRIPAGVPDVRHLTLARAQARLRAADVAFAYDADQGAFGVADKTNWIVCDEHAPDNSDLGKNAGGDAVSALSADVWLDLGHYAC